MNFKKLIIVLGLSLLILEGCTFLQPKPPNPVKYQWGKKGQAPTAVWTDYDWVIVANEE